MLSWYGVRGVVNSIQGEGSCHRQTDHWTTGRHCRVGSRVTPWEQQGVTKNQQFHLPGKNFFIAIGYRPPSQNKLEYGWPRGLGADYIPYHLVYSARNFVPILGLWTRGVALYKRAKLYWLQTTRTSAEVEKFRRGNAITIQGHVVLKLYLTKQVVIPRRVG